MDGFDWKSLQERRKTYKFIGWTALGVGMLLTVDVIFREPVPLNARAAFPISLGLICGSFAMLYLGYRLPLVEAREYIFNRSEDGFTVTVAELCREMRINIHTAGEVIDALMAKGFVQQLEKPEKEANGDVPEYEAVRD